MPAPKHLSAADVRSAIDTLAETIAQRHAKPASVLLLGIANGGIELARRLAERLKAKHGVIDISFHRDDITRHPIPKEFVPTRIPVDVTGATVILVDDVLFSGRTVKAALDELFDHGRPASVELAILVDRGGRKLPVAATYTGLVLDLPETSKVAVTLDPAKPARDTVTILPAKPSA